MMGDYGKSSQPNTVNNMPALKVRNGEEGGNGQITYTGKAHGGSKDTSIGQK